MKVDILPVGQFDKANRLTPVTDPVIFKKGATPSEGGLLSTDIFGVSTKERRLTYSYINLNGPFFTPFIYKMLKRMNRNFEHAVYGTKSFTIDSAGQLIEDEAGETGLLFLYKNWEKIVFKKNKSNIRNERIDLLSSLPKDTIFVKEWVVMPAFFRDVNLQSADSGKISHHEINDLYSRLMRMSSILKSDNSFDFTMNNARAKVQETLVEIYDLLKGKLEKKNGMIRKSLLGKSIDYGARSVISAPIFKANRPEDMEIDYYHSGIPLAQCCSLFTTFIIGWLKRFFQREMEKMGGKFPVRQKDGEMIYLKLKDPAVHFNEEYLGKQLDRFVHSPADRFDKIELPVEDAKNPIYLTFTGRFTEAGETEESPLAQRHATWTDLLYQAAVEVTENKFVWITRYPLLDYFGTFPTYVTVLSTQRTMPMYVGDKVYTSYPVVNHDIPQEQMSVYFLDTVTMSNLYLAGLGGDYDGDQVTVKGVYSQEANAEAEKIMKSKANFLNIYGQNMRKTTNEGVQTLYMLTKFNK